MNDLPNNPTITPSAGVPIFKYWCQKVLPAVYDDSLSYYELLCKLTSKVNEIIITQNTQVDSIKELQNLFTQLNEYVDNYFSNLDVQNEINNKLDSMVSSGEFDNIINPLITPYFEDFQNQINNFETSTNNNIDQFKSSTNNDINEFKTSTNNEIDEFKTTTNSQVQNVIQQLNGKIGMTPHSSFETLQSLQQSNPNHDYIYLISSTNQWAYYNSSSSQFEIGGEYNSSNLLPFNIYENETGIIKNYGNIFNPNNYLDGYFPINDAGDLGENENYFYSDFLPVAPNSNYVLNNYLDNVFYGFYDINKKWISRILNTKNITTPSNCYYLKISAVKSIIPKIVLLPGDTIPDNYYGFTDFIRNTPIIKNLPHAHLLRGSMYVSSIDKSNNDITIHTNNQTILYTENNIALIPEGDFVLPSGNMLVFNLLSKQLEIIPLYDVSRFNTFYNQMMYICTNFDTIVLTDKNVPLNKRIVNKNGLCDYGNISDASYKIPENGTIEIHEGEYNEILEFWDKDINLLGVGNPENIIIYNTNGNYSTPPLEICGGSIQNLTLYAKYDGTLTTEEWSCYAMHTDDNNLVNKKLYCHNVIFKSDFNYCIGIGLRKGADLEFNNCKFINLTDYSIEGIPTKGGAIYFHDSPSETYAGECSISFINCIMSMIGSTSSNIPLIRLQQVLKDSSNKVNVTFINNSTWNIAKNSSGDYWNTGANGSSENGDWLNMKNWKLSLYSHSNNYDVLNYSATN